MYYKVYKFRISQKELINKTNEYLNEKTLTNEKVIKEVIVNLKNNFIHLNNHEKKVIM